ncbi:MAG: NADP-dependent oxidoreductase [Paracoccaceae bacterium]
MKAVEFDRFGGSDVLALVDRPAPAPGPGEIAIDVHAVSVNPVDAKVRAGMIPHLAAALPMGTGRDGAGIVTALGAGVPQDWLGRPVAFLAARGQGAWAETVAVPLANAAPVPDGLAMASAAALPLAGVSAWIGLVETGGVAPGMSVLIQAAAGGIGHLAVQIARARGAQVWGTSSSRNADFVAGLGAMPVPHDAPAPDLPPMDLVFDLMGGPHHAACCAMLRPGGHLVALNAAPFQDVSADHGVTLTIPEIVPGTGALAHVLDLAAAGGLHVEIADTLPFSAFAEAQDRIATGRTRGKIVLTLK